MRELDCAALDAELAEALASPGGADPSRIEAWRAHARGCPRCAASVALLDLAELPAARRDPIADPGPEYWSGFEARLGERLATIPAGRRRRALLVAGAAAAAIALVALLVLALRPKPPTPVTVARDVPPATVAAADAADDDPQTADDWEAAFAEGGPLDTFEDDDGTGLYPAVDDLSPADERIFLEWLSQEEARVSGGRG